ncbi:hypothetical protein SEA_FIZZLES_83 [Microbacterium phage Fizzles]|nr:hypothetical protein SEA_FIZZLES_83 [Microbacterium phage Fizzles]
MTDQIPMRSASERREAARAVVTEYEERSRKLGESITTTYERALYSALVPLLEVPEVGLTEDEIIAEVIQRSTAHVSGAGIRYQYDDLVAMLRDAVRTAEQAALEHWEPADVPSQEFMLRHLGIEYEDARDDEADPDTIRIRTQYIAKEVF